MGSGVGEGGELAGAVGAAAMFGASAISGCATELQQLARRLALRRTASTNQAPRALPSRSPRFTSAFYANLAWFGKLERSLELLSSACELLSAEHITGMHRVGGNSHASHHAFYSPVVRTAFYAVLIMAVVAVASFGIAGQRAAAVSPNPISLSPLTATNVAGTSHTVTAHVTVFQSAEFDVTVTFTVTAGPNTGQTGTRLTNQAGDATFTYTSNGSAGTDTITASGVVRPDNEFDQPVCDTASKTWNAPPPPPPSTGTVVTATSPSCGQVVVSATGVTPSLLHQIVVTPSGGGTPADRECHC